MSSNEIAVMEMSLPERITYARALAEAQGLPKAYRGNPANVLIAMEYGAAIGLPPALALAEIHVVDARPSASAKVISGLVRKAGHRLRVTFDEKTMTATAVIVRHDDPDFEWVAVWDMDKAKRARLDKKDNWVNYPHAMLKARAITEVARDACSEALHGIAYTPEELAEMPVFTVTRTDTPAPSADRLIPTEAGRVNADTGEVVDGEVVEDSLDEFTRQESDAVTQQQLSDLAALFKTLDINNKADGLAMVHSILGPDAEGIEATKQMTREQAATVIDTMTALADSKQQEQQS